MAELGQLGDQGAQRCFADTGHAGQEIGIGLPSRAAAYRAVDVAFELGEFGLQQGEMPLDRSDDPALAGHAASMAFGNDHLDDLPAPCDQLAQGLRLSIGDWPCRRPHRFGEMSDRRRHRSGRSWPACRWRGQSRGFGGD